MVKPVQEMPFPGRGPDAKGPLTREELAWEDDGKLIERTLAGEGRAFEVLMQRYTPYVMATLWTPVGGASQKEDLLQEIFFSAHTRLRSLRRRDRFRPWLRKIIRNCSIDYQRRETAQRRHADQVEFVDGMEADEARRPEQRFEGPREEAALAELREIVVDTLASMGERYRTILYMRVIDEQSLLQIAKTLGLAEGTVRVRLFRGLKKLRKALIRRGVTGGIAQ